LLKLHPPRCFTLKRCLNPGKVILLALLVTAVLVPAVALLRHSAHAQNQQSSLPAPPRKQGEFVPGELLVRFRPGQTVAKTKGTIQLSMLTGARSFRVDINSFGGSDLVEGLRLARVAPERMLDAIKALRARADVLYVEPNYIRHFDAVPNDTFYGSQAAASVPNPPGTQLPAIRTSSSASSTQALTSNIAISKTTSSSTLPKPLTTASTTITMVLLTM
jgi:hypothetical protein